MTKMFMIRNFFKFKKEIIPATNETKTVDRIQLWYVKWKSRYGPFHGETTEEMEAFTSEEEANEFADSLKNAFKLLKYRAGTAVSVIKN